MSQTKTAKKKTIDLDKIQDMADKAGMTASELFEWGLYGILQTYDGTLGWYPRDAADGLKELREMEGEIPEQLIPSDPLVDFASEAGLNFSELNELALLTAINRLNSSEYPDKQPRDLLEDDRREMGPLLPHFQHDRVKVHPFMAALFSGELSAAYVPPENMSNAQVTVAYYLEDFFEAKNEADDLGCHVRGLYDAVRHNPELKQEVAAMKAFYESLDILQRFIFSTR